MEEDGNCYTEEYTPSAVHELLFTSMSYICFMSIGSLIVSTVSPPDSMWIGISTQDNAKVGGRRMGRKLGEKARGKCMGRKPEANV
jgi:hypothetical protein